jgi:CDP-paratose 2-epimerase
VVPLFTLQLPCFNATGVETSTADRSRPAAHVAGRCLVTGGAGFIGCNLAASLLRRGWDVTALDDLSRPGTTSNLTWLRSQSDGSIRFVEADVRDPAAVERAVSRADVVFHLAGQTAVTTSILDPRGDFEANALGTLNVLEAARRSRRVPIVVHASTNKVYGALAHLEVVESATRFQFRELPRGVDETHPLDLHSPYACSKGVADQYTLDYHRIYGLPTVVFRQSCVYGPRQLGSEEQGWVAWIVGRAVERQPVTIFGTGKQVRDLLHVDDLVEAYVLATARIERTAGRVYNIGGGGERTLSIWTELEPLLARALGRTLDTPTFEPARPGDQRVFYCDIGRAAAEFDWEPRIGVEDGLGRVITSMLADDQRQLGQPTAV